MRKLMRHLLLDRQDMCCAQQHAYENFLRSPSLNFWAEVFSNVSYQGFGAQSREHLGRRDLLPSEPPESALCHISNSAVGAPSAAAVAAWYCRGTRCDDRPVIA